MSPRSLAQLLFQFLVWTNWNCLALDYLSFYENLKLADTAVTQTMSAPSICTCFAICRAQPKCTAATYAPDITEQSCFLSNKTGMLKSHLESSNGADHTSLIVGYQLYIESKERAPYNQAKTNCKKFGMRLISLSNAESFNYVKKLLVRASSTVPYWVDMAKINGEWTWGDGVKNVYSNGEGPWASNEPGSRDDAAAVVQGANDVKLYGRASSDWYFYICET